ncbi:MAG TPA: DUF4350 domain-containing protein [Streptosporangiaceae bacterium]|nr:DUF4350 domain-containing protein [Streptosporangiaceae bacterium]
MTLPTTEPLAPPQPGEASAAVAAAAATAEAGQEPLSGGRLVRAWRKWRLLAALAALFVLACVAAVLVAPTPKSNSYLDPASSDSSGTKALANILGDRGFQVTSVYSPAAALAAIGPASGRPASTLVITSPGLLTAAQRRQLGQANADLFLVEPGRVSLAALAPAVQVAGGYGQFDALVAPSCDLIEATLAGSADEGGFTYRIPAGATGCYPTKGFPSVVRYVAGGRTITILGSGFPLTDALLASDGNAALSLNLLNAHRSIVWLTPEPKVASGPPPGEKAAPKSQPALIPHAAWLVVLQLLVALMLTVIWRARRFGPLIAERLPVVVRASETVEGHARLYQARRARGRAATALRDAMLGRIRPALGLTADAPADAVIDGLAGRSRLDRSAIAAITYGPPPTTDLELVKLARDLDDLEREVRSQ